MNEIKQLIAAEAVLLSGDKIVINAVQCELKKKRVRTISEFINIDTPADLKKKLQVSPPLVLVVNGKGVITKKIQDNQTNSISSILPNANPDDYYHQLFQYKDEKFVIIARKTQVDALLEKFISAGFKTIYLVVGPEPAISILPILSLADNDFTIRTASLVLQFDKNHFLLSIDSKKEFDITSAGFENVEYAIGDQYIKSASFISFAAAIKAFSTGLNQEVGVSNWTVNNTRTEFLHAKYFHAISKYLLLFIFLILIVNFLAYNHFYTQNNKIAFQKIEIQRKIEQARKYTSELNNYESFLSKTGWQKSSKTSYFADRIASLIPLGTKLTTMKIAPKLSSDFSKLNFMNDTIQLIGTCVNPADLNQFINNLKNIQSIKNIQMKNYSFNKEALQGIFEIEIVTN